MILRMLLFSYGLMLSAPASAGVETGVGGDIIPDGFQVEFFAQPVEPGSGLRAGVDLETGFRIIDPRSEVGIPDLHPSGWVLKRDSGAGSPDAKTCEQMVRTQSRGTLSRPPAADLNNFLILTLNADHSVGFINPLVSLNSANLMALVPLDTPIAAWDFDADAGRAYLALPDANALAVLDLNAKKVIKRIEVGQQPRKVRVQPDRRYIWVANQGEGMLTAVDAETLSVKAHLPAGEGSLALATEGRSRFLFAAAGGSGDLRVFDAQRMRELSRIELAKGEWALAYSDLAEALYAVHKPTGQVRVIAAGSWAETGRIALNSEVSEAVLTPDGRHLLVLHPTDDSLSVIDTARNRLARILPTGKYPDKIAFTESYAYVHNRDSAEVTLVQLTGLEGEESLPVVQIATGVKAPGDLPFADANMITSLPQGGGALIINPADRYIYYYMEGMLAPGNTLKTYTAPPVGLWVYDRSLQEVASNKGVYSTTVRIDEPGVYDVPFYLPTPQMILCFEMLVKDNSADQPARIKRQIPRMLSRFDQQIFPPNQSVKLRFSLLNEADGTPVEVEDGSVLTFRRGSHWQQRTTVRHLEAGVYQVEFQFPEIGEYYLLFKSPSLKVDYGEMKHLKVRVGSDHVKGSMNGQIVGWER